MKKFIHKLFLWLLICTFIIPHSISMPVYANNNEKPAVHMMQYEDEFTSTVPDARIELQDGAEYDYENGILKENKSEYGTRFIMYLNRNRAAVTGNIVTEFTIRQTELMEKGGEIQMLLFSSYNGKYSSRVGDIRWSKYNSEQSFIRISGSQNEDVIFDPGKSEVKMTIQYNTALRTISVWVDDKKLISDSTEHVYTPDGNLGLVAINEQNVNVELENFKWYYAESEEGIPKVQETIYHEDFENDNAAPTSDDYITFENEDKVSYAVKDGTLVFSTSTANGVYAPTFNLGKNGSKLSGEYVVETTLHNPDGSENYHRVIYGDAMFVEWNTKLNKDYLYINNFVPSREVITLKTSDFAAHGDVLKLTAKFNTDEATTDLWINDKLAWSHNYRKQGLAEADCLTGTSHAYVKTWLFQGSLAIDDIHVYRPVLKELTGDEKIEQAYEALTESTIYPVPLTQNGYLADDLYLPVKGEKDVDISWSVSENAKDVVDCISGAVDRAKEETDVTLTATLSADGGAERTKDFSFKVPALGDTPDNLPAMLCVQTREQFNEYNDKTMVLSPSAVGSMEVKDGKLAIAITQKTGSANNAVIYLNEDKRDINGEFGVEFVMERSSGSNGMQFFLASDSVRSYTCDIRWNNNEVQLGTGWDGSRYLTSELFNFEDFDIGKTLKVTILVNTEAQPDDGLGRLTLLLNNKYADTISISPGPVSFLKFARDNAIVDLTVDNLRFYYLKTNDANAARLDASELNYNDIFKPAEVDDNLIAYDINLPTSGVRGSEIHWESSHPDIISDTGSVVRPSEDTEVTLTARAVCGQSEYEVNFKVTVLRGGEGDLVLLKKDMNELTLDSILTGELTADDLISDDLDFYTTGKYGSTITWSTSNPELISAAGKVKRPPNRDGDIYVIITAEFTNGDFTLSKQFRLGVIPETYSASNIPLPERFENVLNSDFKVHTTGEKYNSDLVGFGYSVGDWSGCLCRGWGGKITEENGYVEMVRDRSHNPDTGAELDSTYFQYTFSPLGVGIGDLAAIQYTLTKKGTGEIHQKLNGLSSAGSYNNLVLIYWQKDGTFRLRHKIDGGKDKDTYTKKAYTDSVQVTVMTDENSGTFSMWLDGECVLYQVYPYNGSWSTLYRMDTSIEGTNFLTLEISNYDIYKVYPLDHLRPVQDSALLTEEVIRNGVYNPSPGRLSYDLNLITSSRYGSSISWTSTHPEIIEPTGRLNRPLDLTQEVEVTVTAKIAYSCFSVLKDFTFLVQPCYSDDENSAQRDHDFMTEENWNLLSFDDTSLNHVTTSLNLLDKGPYGSTYYWKSSNTSVITNSGRVIRPRWNEPEKKVELTLVTVYGSAVKTKIFNLTVIPEEELKDPNHMSNEEFFGVWDNNKWTTEPKFKYGDYKELDKVEAAAKLGDYELAKTELLNYMKSRPKSFVVASISRDPAYAEAFTMSNVYDSENHSHYAALGEIRSRDYEEVAITLNESIIKGSVTSYKVAARYNEKSTVKVLSSEMADESRRPRAELIVNGSRKVFYACGDTTISGGSNRYTNFSEQSEMPVTYFGPFQGEGVSDMLIQFDFSDIKEGDSVTEATMYLNAKLVEPYADSKEIIVTREGTDWDASTVTLDNIDEYTFNYNGNPGKNTWRKPANAESEYILQTSRLANQTAALAEYVYTGNEKYAYAVIYDIMDFIIDTQGKFVYAEELKNGRVPSSMDWEKIKDHNIVRYGAYPRALDSAIRQKSLINMFDIITKSQYMSADICTAILKNLWHSSVEVEKFLVHPDSQDQGANQKIIEAECFSTTAAFMPEFDVSDYLIDSSIPVMEDLLANSFYPDGSYIEGSDGYTGLALGQFNTFLEKILIMGKDFSKGARELLGKANQYVANLASNGGVSIAWGDNGKSTTHISMRGQDYYKLSKDEETNFIYTYGRAGTMPEWTSRLYEGNMLAVMRSDWTDEGTYLFMPSGSLYPHAHYDANQIILNAYKKAMLIDPGYFSYSSSPERTYVKSTLGHNTVEIDNTSQRLGPNVESTNAVPLATKHSWVSNSNYDFYSVTNYSNQAQAVDDLNNCIEHRRTVTFIKPNIVIVSDLMSPDMQDDAEASKPHSYKQLWHMSSLANMGVKSSEHMLYSNFPSGAQIKIASADTDAFVKVENGIDTEGWGVASEAKYGYYQKENVAGKVTFDTVLLPYKLTGNVKAEHISLGAGIETSDATAMKISTSVDGEDNVIYYMLDYDHEDGAVHDFANYTTDAEHAVVRTSDEGKLIEAILYNGSYIKTKGGEIILSAGEKAVSLSLTIEKGSGEIYASDDVAMEKVKFIKDNTIKSIRYNDKAAQLDAGNGEIVPSDKEEEINNGTDKGNDKGGISDGKNSGSSQGGSSGGSSGGIGGGVVSPGTGTAGQTSQQTFADITNHWAKESIARMAASGVVKGDGINFRPDDSISRAELVTMVVRALKLDLDGTDTPYADVSVESWYAGYVKKALDAGIISSDSKFRPDDPVTREEMSKILSCANALLTGSEISVSHGFELSFNDADRISAWAKDYVRYANSKGLMNGMEDGSFAPLDTATRAQVATVLDRMLSA